MRASTARARPAGAQTTDLELPAALPVISGRIAEIQSMLDATESEWLPTTDETLLDDFNGFTPPVSESGSTSPTSPTSGALSNGLSERLPVPNSVRGLAAQANRMATAVLNNDIDLDRARVYSSIVRAVAQMMSIEVTRARFLRTEPVLEFEPEE